MNVRSLETVADQFRTGKINSKTLSNLRAFAKENNMYVSSIPLKDGTSAKILADRTEIDCLIMKNGKVLTARGCKNNNETVWMDIDRIYTHILRRNRAKEGFNTEREGMFSISNYLDKFPTDI